MNRIDTLIETLRAIGATGASLHGDIDLIDAIVAAGGERDADKLYRPSNRDAYVMRYASLTRDGVSIRAHSTRPPTPEEAALTADPGRTHRHNETVEVVEVGHGG